MKKFNKNSIRGVSIAAFLVLGLAGPIAAFAASTPSLGMADTYSVLGGTFTNTNPTTINGDVGYTTGPVAPPIVNGTIYGAGVPTPQARIDTANALGLLNAEVCPPANDLGVIVDLSLVHGAVYTPGVYCSSGAMSIGVGGITLNGSGTYIFRGDGALTSVVNSNVTLLNGASSCDVFWTMTAATTLAANTTFMGTIIDNANAISVGANTVWTGRALSLGAGVVTTDTDTITKACTIAALTPVAAASSRQPATINVVKVVVNDNGGTKTIADFPLFVNGRPVISGVTNTFPAPAPAYAVTETSDAHYAQTFSGDCGIDGRIGLSPGDNKFCIITNNDIGLPLPIPPVPPLIDVVKVPSPLALPAGPGLVMYTYTLRNIGTVPVTDVTMVGDSCSPIVLISGDTNADAKLDVNETWVYRCSTVLSETHTNTVVATGWANGLSAVDIASATVIVGVPIVPPLIHVTKVPSPLALLAKGGIVMYAYTVTNPGTVALHNVAVSDDKCGPLYGPFGDSNHNNLLDHDESWSYACRINLIKTTTNTVVAEGEANGLKARDFAVVTVVVAAAVPGLPNTGLDLAENTLWDVASIGLLMIVAASVVLIRRKRTV